MHNTQIADELRGLLSVAGEKLSAVAKIAGVSSVRLGRVLRNDTDALTLGELAKVRQTLQEIIRTSKLLNITKENV